MSDKQKEIRDSELYEQCFGFKERRSNTYFYTVLLVLLLAVFVIFILPDMMRLLDNFVGMMRPEANYH
jgi:hypothetical protein